MVIFFLVTWVLFFAVKGSAQAVSRLRVRPGVTADIEAPARTVA